MACSRISSQNEYGRRFAKESSGKPGKAHPREAGINATGVNRSRSDQSQVPSGTPTHRLPAASCSSSASPHPARERKLIEKAD